MSSKSSSGSRMLVYLLVGKLSRSLIADSLTADSLVYLRVYNPCISLYFLSYADGDLWGRLGGLLIIQGLSVTKIFFFGCYAILDRTWIACCVVPADGAGNNKIICSSSALHCNTQFRTRHGQAKEKIFCQGSLQSDDGTQYGNGVTVTKKEN